MSHLVIDSLDPILASGTPNTDNPAWVAVMTTMDFDAIKAAFDAPPETTLIHGIIARRYVAMSVHGFYIDKEENAPDLGT